MDDALPGDGFCENADHDAQHGRAAVEALNLLELLFMNGVCSGILEPLVARLLLIHRIITDVEQCNRGLTFGLSFLSPFFHLLPSGRWGPVPDRWPEPGAGLV